MKVYLEATGVHPQIEKEPTVPGGNLKELKQFNVCLNSYFLASFMPNQQVSVPEAWGERPGRTSWAANISVFRVDWQLCVS